MARTVYSTIGETVEAFIKERTDYGRNPGETLYFKNKVLYSYGSHFPLAIEIKRKEFTNHYPGKIFWVNGDRYSPSTSKHQSCLFRKIDEKNRVEIPYSVIRFIDYGGIDVIKEFQVIDTDPDRWEDTNEFDRYGFPIRIHHLGASLIQYKDRVFLSGTDESGVGAGLYHLTELDISRRLIPTTIHDAYEYLKPDKVRLAEASNVTVYRQGEWFFIPASDTINTSLNKPVTQYMKNELLRHRDTDRPARHRATDYVMHNDIQYVRGTIRHIEGDHKMLKLYETPVTKRWWFEAVENIQVRSWSINGKVD